MSGKLLQVHICLGSSSKSKNRDELMNYTVRVRLSFIFFVRNQLRVYSIFQFVFGQRDLFDISNQPCS